MIVVVGSPLGRRGLGAEVVAAGVPVAIAAAAAAAGSSVQLIGKVGEGADGDAVLLALAQSGVGHVALLRDVEAVPIAPADSEAEIGDEPLDTIAGLDGSGDDGTQPGAGDSGPAAPSLDAADLELALRYLPDYRVVVIAQALDTVAVAAVVEAARWAGAALVVAMPSSGETPDLTDDATVLEAPTDDAEGAFATLVGRYAAALDAGAQPAQAFAGASGGTGWAAVAD